MLSNLQTLVKLTTIFSGNTTGASGGKASKDPVRNLPVNTVKSLPCLISPCCNNSGSKGFKCCKCLSFIKQNTLAAISIFNFTSALWSRVK